jgi:hypothetical protein
MVLDVNKNGIPDLLEKKKPGQFDTTFQPSFLPIFLPDEDAPNQQGWNPDQALNWFNFVAPKGKAGGPKATYYNELVSLMDRLGIPKDKRGAAWADALSWTQTPGSGSVGDPMDYFMGFVDVSKYGSGADGRFGTTKSKTKTTTQYSTSQATVDLMGAYKSELGMEAQPADVQAYQKAVNKAARKEPAIYEATSTTAPGKGGVAVTSTTDGTSRTGFNPAQFAVDYARSNPEFAENFAVRNFMGLIEQSLTDPNRIGQVIE